MEKATLTVGRFEIPCRVHSHGPECLVCVNGLQQTMASWRSVVRRLAAPGRYRLAVFDFPNQGRARGDAAGPPLPLNEQVEVLQGVVDAIAPRQPVALIGGSWGAIVAAAYAARFPRRVSKLLLGSFQPRANRRLREVARRGRLLVEQGRVEELADMFLTEFGSRMLPDLQRALRAQFRMLRPEQLRQMSLQGTMLAEASGLAEFVNLSAIRAETLVVNGAEDPIVDPCDPALRQIPSVEVRVVPGAGHFLHLERAETVEIYDEFFHRDARRAAAPSFSLTA